jgi:Flp pilus assembly protein CpaB
MLSTREGSIILAVGAALLAGILLLVFASQYRNHVDEDAAPTSVLVARNLIPKGSSGDVVASDKLVTSTSFKGSQVKEGAVTDPAALKGRVAARDIYPGQQVTVGDFTTGGTTVAAKLTGAERAVSIPVDQAHGLVGQVQTGDHVDVLAGFGQGGSGSDRPTLRTLIDDVTVLATPSGDGGSGGVGEGASNIILRVNSDEATKLAFTADNGKVWIVLRPPTGASKTKPSAVSLQSLLAGDN